MVVTGAASHKTRNSFLMPLSPELIERLGRQPSRQLVKQAARWSRLWGIPSLVDEVTIGINVRLRTAVARYRKDHQTIELGPRFFALRKRQPEVLAHELAHAAVARLRGAARQIHGAEWRALVQTAGFIPRVRLISDNARSPARSRRLSEVHCFEHRCSVCHMARVASRPVRRWRCARCVQAGLPGLLVILERANPR